ncbi:hypothetical protein GCM10022239_12280 [Leifsonia bigeumensis]|uniref:Uncharacterized protein n=1 Tax=Leifsonella bigeumensis TaxID=433643 RepID=A0ABP7FEY8_9MICO
MPIILPERVLPSQSARDQASKKTTYTQAPASTIAPRAHRVSRMREKLKVTVSLYRSAKS